MGVNPGRELAMEVLLDCLVFEWIRKQSIAKSEDEGVGTGCLKKGEKVE